MLFPSSTLASCSNSGSRRAVPVTCATDCKKDNTWLRLAWSKKEMKRKEEKEGYLPLVLVVYNWAT